MRRTLALAIGVVVGLATTQANAIVGGQRARSRDFAAVAALDNGCSAVLIDERHVLTAAHCWPVATAARFGRRSVALEQCTVHPDGGAGSPTDVAVCRTTHPVRNVRPLTLSTATLDDDAEIDVVLVGYGFERDGDAFGTLRRARTRLRVDGALARGGGSGTSICRGDSGGPALVRRGGRWRVVALASATFTPSCDGSEGMFTLVPSLRAWIDGVTRRSLP